MYLPKWLKVIMNFDFSKAPDPDCIPVAVLKNCEGELSYILAELFNKCLNQLLDQRQIFSQSNLI